MLRLPRLPELGFLLALPLTMLAVASCGGRIDAGSADGGNTPDAGAADSAAGTTGTPVPPGGDSGGITTGSDASAEPVDAAGLACAAPIHVSIGETLNGSTCGGALLSEYRCGDDQPHPAVYFVVDAPDAASFTIKLVGGPTPSGGGEQLSVYGYDTCGEAFLMCTSGSAASGWPVPLFALVRWDVPCGDFTISVVAG